MVSFCVISYHFGEEDGGEVFNLHNLRFCLDVPRNSHNQFKRGLKNRNVNIEPSFRLQFARKRKSVWYTSSKMTERN